MAEFGFTEFRPIEGTTGSTAGGGLDAGELALRAVGRPALTGRPGLEANVQSIILFSQLLDRSLYRRRTILDLADEPDLAGAAALRDRNRVLLLGYIKRDKCFAILSHCSPAVREDRLGPSEMAYSA
ncbi:hypothetical protein NKI41_32625 [Mesorhizobium sp. M0601]|uniref:hypothetical protein n=1 Tax=Mesorhizobium sp. M0601 TaxID=2956969 RepID=UPI003336E8A2